MEMVYLSYTCQCDGFWVNQSLLINYLYQAQDFSISPVGGNSYFSGQMLDRL